jgi:hypothetical protein
MLGVTSTLLRVSSATRVLSSALNRGRRRSILILTKSGKILVHVFLCCVLCDFPFLAESLSSAGVFLNFSQRIHADVGICLS